MREWASPRPSRYTSLISAKSAGSSSPIPSPLPSSSDSVHLLTSACLSMTLSSKFPSVFRFSPVCHVGSPCLNKVHVTPLEVAHLNDASNMSTSPSPRAPRTRTCNACTTRTRKVKNLEQNYVESNRSLSTLLDPAFVTQRSTRQRANTAFIHRKNRSPTRLFQV